MKGGAAAEGGAVARSGASALAGDARSGAAAQQRDPEDDQGEWGRESWAERRGRMEGGAAAEGGAVARSGASALAGDARSGVAAQQRDPEDDQGEWRRESGAESSDSESHAELQELEAGGQPRAAQTPGHGVRRGHIRRVEELQKEGRSGNERLWPSSKRFKPQEEVEVAEDAADALLTLSAAAAAELVAAGPAQAEPGAVQTPRAQRRSSCWSPCELELLRASVKERGCDWKAVGRDVGTKSNVQCKDKVAAEVEAGRMQEPGGRRTLSVWSAAELLALEQAVAQHGRDWGAVSAAVGTKSITSCWNKVDYEVTAGRMEEPGGKRELWSAGELLALQQAVDQHGRDWAAVALFVKTKGRAQCINKVAWQVAAGIMQEPAGKRALWSAAELLTLEQAVAQHGNEWEAISLVVGGGKTPSQCKKKCENEVAKGRMKKPSGNQGQAARTRGGRDPGKS
jgi:hypothetical protein